MRFDLTCTYCGQTGHRASQCPRRTASKPADKAPSWPFPPALLAYPTLPPGARPTRTPRAPAPDAPEALF